MGKFFSPNDLQRNGVLEFQNGKITIDFNRQEIIGVLSNNSNKSFRICTKEEYTQTKYSIQVDMVERCFEEHIIPAVVDGSDLQIRTLEWLFSQNRNWNNTNKLLSQ